jgi:hypothetical protein
MENKTSLFETLNQILAPSYGIKPAPLKAPATPPLKVVVLWDRDFVGYGEGYRYSFYAVREGKVYNLAPDTLGFSQRIKKEIEEKARKIWGEAVELDFSQCPAPY